MCLVHGKDSEGNVGVFGDNELFFILGVWEGGDSLDGGHWLSEEGLELGLVKVLSHGTYTVDSVLKDVNLAGLGPHGDVDELRADFVNHHGVSGLAFVNVVDEEEWGILELLVGDVLIWLHNTSEVEFDVLVEDWSGIFAVDGHEDIAAFIDIDWDTSEFI